MYGKIQGLGSLKSFLWYALQLSGANILCFLILNPLTVHCQGWLLQFLDGSKNLFPSWATSGLTFRVAAVWWLDDWNILSLLIWQVTFLVHTLFSSFQSLSHVRLSETPWTARARLPCPSPTPGTYSNSCPLSWRCHPTISSSVAPVSSCLQSFRASGSFTVSQFFALGGKNIGVLASASVLPMNIQDNISEYSHPVGVLIWRLKRLEQICGLA